MSTDRQRIQLRILRRYTPLLVFLIIIGITSYWKKENPQNSTELIVWLLSSYSILIHSINYLNKGWIVRKIWYSSPNAYSDRNYKIPYNYSNKNKSDLIILAILIVMGPLLFMIIINLLLFSSISWYKWPLIGFLTLSLIGFMIWMNKKANLYHEISQMDDGSNEELELN
jgi:hypothetical protein